MSTQNNEHTAGEELVKQELITKEELAEAKQREKQSGIPWYRQLIQMKKLDLGIAESLLKREFHPKAKHDEHQQLGRSLLQLGAITDEQLNEALAEQRRSGRLLGNILLNRGFVTRQAIDIALSKQHGLEYTDLTQTPSEQAALEAVPESMARRTKMIPVRLEGDKLTVLIASPQTREVLRDVGVLLGKRIYPILTTVDDVKAEIATRYSELKYEKKTAQEKVAVTRRRAFKPAVSKAAKPEGEPTVEEKQAVETKIQAKLPTERTFEELAKDASGMPVIKLVSTIIEGAVNSGATDIHLDPQEPEMRVRYRIDGILHDVMTIPPEIEAAVASRVKIMADIDITETRHPQDGHIGIQVGTREFDIRVATMPTFLGERVVLRLLDQSSVLAGIKDLGLEQEDEELLLRLILQPYGMVLVTGPTGSGKTTTLYAALNQKNVMTDSIVTLEDPVEYQLSGINQVQIETDIGLTFARVLRASLRHDIDVLLVGEMRDTETALIGTQAALTGHLVFSTLHTNDAPEALSRLRNMGVPSYLIASALTAVIAQRLVRKICENCKTPFTADKSLLKALGLPATTTKLYRGKGCEQCYRTGNKGRTGIFEVIEVTPEIRRMIAADEPVEKVAKAAKLKTMADRCRLKVKRGTVAPEEFFRVIRL